MAAVGHLQARDTFSGSNCLMNTGNCNDFSSFLFETDATDLLATSAGARTLMEYDEEILMRSNVHLGCVAP
jgi:hypothetical protein